MITAATPQDLMQHYGQALDSQAWAAVEPLVHENISVTFSTGTFRGIAAVKEAFVHNFSVTKNEQYEISDLHWVHIGDDFAVCQFRFHWQGEIKGKLASGSGRGTSTLIKQDQTWLLLSEHLGPEANS